MAIDSWQKLVALPNPKLRTLIETNPAKHLPCGSGWTDAGSSTYWYACDEMRVSAVTDDGEELIRKTSLAGCQATAGSYFYDKSNKKLYVRAFGSDNLSSSSTSVIIVMYCWKYFSTDAIKFTPWGDNLLLDGEFEEWNSATDAVHWIEYTEGTTTINREDDPTKVLSGGHCVRIDVDSSNSVGLVGAEIGLTPGGKCKLSVWHKNSVAAKQEALLFYDTVGNVYLDSNGDWQVTPQVIPLPIVTEWSYFELEFYAHASYSAYIFRAQNWNSASSSVYFDKASVQELDGERQYMPIVRKDSLPALDIGVDDIVEGVYSFNFGSLSVNNPGWWDVAGAEYIWTNRAILIKMGGESLPYTEYMTYFVGRISDYYVSDLTTILTVKDLRVSTFAQLPVNHYWKGTGSGEYENLDEADEGRCIPLFYGVKEDIVPVCIDPEDGAGGRWKIADGKIKEITEIRWIHDDWEEPLTTGTDYTEYLNDGEFVLHIAFDPTSESLEVDAKGFVDEDNNLLTRAGDIALDILKKQLKFLNSELDLTSFAHASAIRTYECCLYLDVDTSSRDVLQTLARSVVGFLVPTEEGKLSFEIYESGTPSGALELTDRDYMEWKVKKENKFIRNKVVVEYDKNPKTGVSEIVEKTSSATLYKYQARETLNLETYLKNKADAQDVATGVLGMCEQPITVVETGIGLRGFGLFPTRKVLMSRSRAPDQSGSWDKKILRVRAAAKDSSSESVGLVALDDLELLGEGLCSVCYLCQTCYSAQASCSVCYTCELCNTDQGGCQVCNTCQLCNTAQSGCGTCNTCEKCDVCQYCFTGCQSCNLCESCVHCQIGVSP